MEGILPSFLICVDFLLQETLSFTHLSRRTPAMNVLRILVVAVVLQASSPQSPSALIEGRVVGPAGNPLPKATVALQAVNAGTQRAAPQSIISNGDGSFSFDKLLPGTYRLTASSAGFTKSE